MSADRDGEKRRAKKRERNQRRRNARGSHSTSAVSPEPPPTRFSVPLGAALEQVGPLVVAEWSVPVPLEEQLIKEGRPVPRPVRGWVLVDTGAGKTCIAQHTAEQLELQPHGTCNSFGAHGTQTSDRYCATFRLGITNQHTGKTLWLTFEDHDVMGIPKMKESFDRFGIRDGTGALINVIGVLGREFLRHVKFQYDGPSGRIDFEIDMAALQDATPANARAVPKVAIV